MIKGISIKNRVFLASFYVLLGTLVIIVSLVYHNYSTTEDRAVEQALEDRRVEVVEFFSKPCPRDRSFPPDFPSDLPKPPDGTPPSDLPNPPSPPPGWPESGDLEDSVCLEGILAMAQSGGVQAKLLLPDGTVMGGNNLDAPLRKEIVFSVLEQNSGDVIQVTLWVDIQDIQDRKAALGHNMVVAGLVILAIASAILMYVIRIALRPLEYVAKAANRIKDGERGVRLEVENTNSEIGKTAVAINNMLDEIEGTEKRAKAAEKQATQAADQMSNFLSTAAHELKTPMAGMQAAAEALIQIGHSDPETSEELTLLLAREAKRSGYLVTNLLEAAKIEAGVALRFEQVDLDKLLKEEQHRVKLERPGVNFVVQGETLLIDADRSGLLSIARNIIQNALKATGSSGTIVTNTTRIVLDDTDFVQLDIANSGATIPEDERERIFERLVRLKSTATTQEGSGLGLSIARGYAMQHGGDVTYIPGRGSCEEVRDSAGHLIRLGSCFRITLPITQPNDDLVDTAEESGSKN